MVVVFNLLVIRQAKLLNYCQATKAKYLYNYFHLFFYLKDIFMGTTLFSQFIMNYLFPFLSFFNHLIFKALAKYYLVFQLAHNLAHLIHNRQNSHSKHFQIIAFSLMNYCYLFALIKEL